MFVCASVCKHVWVCTHVRAFVCMCVCERTRLCSFSGMQHQQDSVGVELRRLPQEGGDSRLAQALSIPSSPCFHQRR